VKSGIGIESNLIALDERKSGRLARAMKGFPSFPSRRSIPIHPLKPRTTMGATKMKEKTLADFPQFVKVNDTVVALRTEQQEIAAGIQAIEIELSKPKPVQLNGEDAWQQALEGEDHIEIDSRCGLREEFSMLDG
jgi:hypothetical protein